MEVFGDPAEILLHCGDGGVDVAPGFHKVVDGDEVDAAVCAGGHELADPYAMLVWESQRWENILHVQPPR